MPWYTGYQLAMSRPFKKSADSAVSLAEARLLEIADTLEPAQRVRLADALISSVGTIKASVLMRSSGESDFQFIPATGKIVDESFETLNELIGPLGCTARLEMADLLLSSVVSSGAGKVPVWYTQIARQIEREDGLINQRMTWMMTIEAFLFGGLGLSLKPEKDMPLMSYFLIVAFISTGIATAHFGGKGLRAAIGALEHLKNRYLRMPAGDRQRLIRPFGAPALHKGASDLIRGLPSLMMKTWIALAILFVFGCGIRVGQAWMAQRNAKPRDGTTSSPA